MRQRLLVIACVVLAGCGDAATNEANDVIPVPACVEKAFRAELHVDAGDPRKVWATEYETGLVVAVAPRPPGQFRVDDDRPTFLLDGRGDVVSFNGEISKTGCLDAARGIVFFGPADLPDPNRPPN